MSKVNEISYAINDDFEAKKSDTRNRARFAWEYIGDFKCTTISIDENKVDYFTSSFGCCKFPSVLKFHFYYQNLCYEGAFYFDTRFSEKSETPIFFTDHLKLLTINQKENSIILEDNVNSIYYELHVITEEKRNLLLNTIDKTFIDTYKHNTKHTQYLIEKEYEGDY